jgi:ornithine cyclodeaminase/alanine dehydrogenase-like protein (mu-crystallin family)
MQQIDQHQVWDRLTMVGAIDALERTISSNGIPDGPARMHLEEAGQLLLVMPSLVDGWAGVKLITIDPQNPQRGVPIINGVYTIFAPPTLEPAASIDGRALTELRTAAVSGLATRHLARADAGRLVIFGAGAQGRSHLLAMSAVRDLEEVRIVAPRPESVEAFIAFAAEHVSVPVLPGTPGDVADADLVCTCTSSSEPVFDGRLLPPGVHVNAIGAYTPEMRELDGAAIAGSRIVVETRAAALSEKGDLLQAEAEARWHRDDIVADLSELLRDGTPGRTEPAQRTVFASVGLAFEDLVVARAVLAGDPRPATTG